MTGLGDRQLNVEDIPGFNVTRIPRQAPPGLVGCPVCGHAVVDAAKAAAFHR